MNSVRNVRAVTVIPATPDLFKPIKENGTRNKRVAAYARVSTELEEQQSSFDAQLDYYTKYIQTKEDWDFVEVYTDEGISATSTKKRDGFNRMIADALSGKIDLIVTKSISRFARNTVDTLTNVRLLKDKNVEIYFEKENIYTLDSKGELLIAIMSSLAQDESRNISENVTWGKRKCFSDGKISLPYKNFLGYEKGEDGLPKIIEEDAKVVRLIYKLFLEGFTPSSIAKQLMGQEILSPAGKRKWGVSTVISILTNEKYKGDAILQKKFTTDFLTKKLKVNEGEVPQYYVENSHPAIIPPETFGLVQEEFARRKSLGGYTTSYNCLSSRIVCGNCGSSYGSKVWHANSKYQRTVWQCNNKFKQKEKCQTPHLHEDTVKQLFVEVFNQMIKNKDAIIKNYRSIIKQLTDCQDLKDELIKVDDECNAIEIMVENFVGENTRVAMDQEEYKRRYNAYADNYEKLRNRHMELTAKINSQEARKNQIHAFLSTLAEQDQLLTEFDETLWRCTMTEMVVHSSDELTFRFKDGAEIKWPLSPKERMKKDGNKSRNQKNPQA